MLDLREFEKLIYESPKKEKNKIVAGEFFKKYRNRYLINIIFSFLQKEEKLEFHLISKNFYNAYIMEKDFQVCKFYFILL